MIRKLVLPVIAAGMLVFAIFHVVRRPAGQAAGGSAGPAGPGPRRGHRRRRGSHRGPDRECRRRQSRARHRRRSAGAAGQPVSAGAALFRLDGRIAQGEVKLREANLSAARRKLAAPGGIAAARRAAGQRGPHPRGTGQRGGQGSGGAAGRRPVRQEDHRRGATDASPASAAMVREQPVRAQADDDLLRAGAWDLDRAVALRRRGPGPGPAGIGPHRLGVLDRPCPDRGTGAAGQHPPANSWPRPRCRRRCCWATSAGCTCAWTSTRTICRASTRIARSGHGAAARSACCP